MTTHSCAKGIPFIYQKNKIGVPFSTQILSFKYFIQSKKNNNNNKRRTKVLNPGKLMAKVDI